MGHQFSSILGNRMWSGFDRDKHNRAQSRVRRGLICPQVSKGTREHNHEEVLVTWSSGSTVRVRALSEQDVHHRRRVCSSLPQFFHIWNKQTNWHMRRVLRWRRRSAGLWVPQSLLTISENNFKGFRYSIFQSSKFSYLFGKCHKKFPWIILIHHKTFAGKNVTLADRALCSHTAAIEYLIQIFCGPDCNYVAQNWNMFVFPLLESSKSSISSLQTLQHDFICFCSTVWVSFHRRLNALRVLASPSGSQRPVNLRTMEPITSTRRSWAVIAFHFPSRIQLVCDCKNELGCNLHTGNIMDATYVTTSHFLPLRVSFMLPWCIMWCALILINQLKFNFEV